MTLQRIMHTKILQQPVLVVVAHCKQRSAAECGNIHLHLVLLRRLVLGDAHPSCGERTIFGFASGILHEHRRVDPGNCNQNAWLWRLPLFQKEVEPA